MNFLRLIPIAAVNAAAVALAGPSYCIVGTGQTKCYDSRREIAPPRQGQPFYGQDAQQRSVAPSYTLGADGLTVMDNRTGLTWQRSPNLAGGAPRYSDKLTYPQAAALPAKLNAMKFAGFSDWRLPTIKELYSLILFSGIDSGPDSTPARMQPFLDTNYFKFSYGDENNGERVIDSQWATGSTYAANPNQMFGVNFADGRIKGYGTRMPGRGEKKFYVICCRGNPRYGQNDFRDNADGTVTDRATGLMWARNDSGRGMNWEAALAWVQQRSAEKHLGHSDWRLPNAKELQSLLDYSRSPDTSRSAAISPVFACTAITNEAGATDYPFYWSSTTHASTMGGGAAEYLAFGRAAGWPTGFPGRGGRGGPGGLPPGVGPSGSGGSVPARYADVHGAGAQRSDPKAGDPAAFPRGRGPQGDVVRINNFVRLVRSDSSAVNPASPAARAPAVSAIQNIHER